MDKLVPTTGRKVAINILHWEEVMQYTKEQGYWQLFQEEHFQQPSPSLWSV
jgi:hypothetical protein